MKSVGKRASKYAVVPLSGDSDTTSSQTVGGKGAGERVAGRSARGSDSNGKREKEQSWFLAAAAAVGSEAAAVATENMAAGINSKENNAPLTDSVVGKFPSVDYDSEKKEDEDWAQKMQLLSGGSSAGSERQVAFSLFEHLDIDGDQRICPWELARFLPSAIGCTGDKKMELSFFCETFGLDVEEDEEGMVIVAGWKEGSAAAEHPSLMIGMRLLSIDGWDLPYPLVAAAAGAGQSGVIPSCLKKCQRVLEEIHGDVKAVHTLEVATPAIVVTHKNRWLDMNVGGDFVAVSVPLGVYSTREAYFAAMQEAARDQHPKTLGLFGVKHAQSQPYAMLSAGDSPFRILWGSGLNRSSCCRRLLFCNGEQDTDDRTSHTTGRWDSTLLLGGFQRLNLKAGMATAFAEHLILETRDRAGKGDEISSLEYEDFCILHATYFSSQEGLRRARDVAMMGFMGMEEVGEVQERQTVDLARRRRLRRMIRHRQWNRERSRQQLSRMLETGARLRLGGVIHVQQRGWADHHHPSTLRSREAHPQEEAAPCSTSETRSPEQNMPAIDRENGDIENQIYEGGIGEGEEGRRRDGVGDVGWSGVAGEESRERGRGKKVSAKKEAVYSKEDLAKRKERLLSQRARTKAIKRSQEKVIKARALDIANQAKTFEAELGGAGQWGASKRTVELAKLGLEDCRSRQAGKRPQPEDIHPAFLGYFHRKTSKKSTWDAAMQSPVFFGSLSGALTKIDAARGEGNLTAIKAIAKGAAYHRTDHGTGVARGVVGVGVARSDDQERVCLAFPPAPVTRGKVRQRLRTVGEAYDRGELVHPSCFGLIMFPDAQDPRHQTPVFRGYEMARKPRRGGQGLEEDEQPTREDYIAHRKGHPCAVCLVGKPGCPSCWQFPEGWMPHDFAYLGPFKEVTGHRSSRPTSRGGSVASVPAQGNASVDRDEGVSVSSWPVAVGRRGVGGTKGDKSTAGGQWLDEEEQVQRVKPEFHTDLTTTAAISLYRSVVSCIVRIFVKVIPCGTATCLWMESSWPISYLYDLWRTNAVEGNTVDAFMFLPTMSGQWNLDNRNLPETDTTLGVHTGSLPLSTYNLMTARSTVTVLCTTFFSAVKTKESITRYIAAETGAGRTAVTDVFQHLVGCPRHPENDPVQKALCGLMEHRVQQQQEVDEKDAREEREKHNGLLLDAEKTRKETALALKRTQVAHGSKEWRTTQRTLRDEAAAAAAFAAERDAYLLEQESIKQEQQHLEDNAPGGQHAAAATNRKMGPGGAEDGGIKTVLSKLNLSLVRQKSRKKKQ